MPSNAERIAEALQSLPLFRTITAARILDSANAWSERQLARGEVLWREGEPAIELCVVHTGALSIRVNEDEEVGLVRAGELVGEAAAFLPGTARTASVVAAEDTRLLVLPSSWLRLLRHEHSEVYDALLRSALRVMVRRVRAADARIARLVDGDQPSPSRSEPSAVAKLFRRFSESPSGDAPTLAPVLRTLPSLDRCTDQHLGRILTAFTPRQVREGELLFLEGEKADGLYLVAQGQVDVVRNVGRQNARTLVRLGPGALFGTAVVSGSSRTASCLAASDGWIFQMRPKAFHALRDESGRAFREALLSALGQQLRVADGLLGEVLRGERTPDPVDLDPSKLEQAHRALQAYISNLGIEDIVEADLDTVEPDDA